MLFCDELTKKDLDRQKIRELKTKIESVSSGTVELVVLVIRGTRYFEIRLQLRSL